MSSSMLKKVKFDDKGSFGWTFDSKVQTISFYIEKKNEYLGEDGKWEQSKVFFEIVPIYKGRDIVGEVQIDINTSIINIIVCSKTTDSFRFILLADNIEIGSCTLSTRKFNKPSSCSHYFSKQEGGKILSEHIETVSYGDLNSTDKQKTYSKINLKKPELPKDHKIVKPNLDILDEGNNDVLQKNQNDTYAHNDSEVVSFDALNNNIDTTTANNGSLSNGNESITTLKTNTNNVDFNQSSGVSDASRVSSTSGALGDSEDIDIRFKRAKNEELLPVSNVPLIIYWVGIPLGIIVILYIVYMILNYIGQ